MDEGWMIVSGNRSVNDNIRKKLFKLFKSRDFEIEVNVNKKVFQYLDVELNQQTGSVSLYIKPNTKLRYMNAGSTHPAASIAKHIPKGIECRLSRGHKTKLEFKPQIKQQIIGGNKKYYLV